MKACLNRQNGKEQSLSRKLLDVYGYFSGTLDSHAGEYIPYAHEFYGVTGINFAAYLNQEHQRWQYLRELAEADTEWDKFAQYSRDQSIMSEELRLDNFFKPRSWADTLAFPIIASVAANAFHRMPALNLVNTGQIENLPRGIFVETPGVVDGASGIRPVAIGELPRPLAAFNRRDIDQMELIAEAGATGSRNLVLQAMLLDPVTDSVVTMERTLDEMLKINAPYLPQFA
jgi:alpha-galactosidase